MFRIRKFSNSISKTTENSARQISSQRIIAGASTDENSHKIGESALNRLKNTIESETEDDEPVEEKDMEYE